MRTLIVLVSLMTACGELNDPDDTGSMMNGGEDPTPLADIDNGTFLSQDGDCDGESITFDTPYEGRLPGGYDFDMSGWLADGQVACTPFPSEFPGPYSITRIDIPASTKWEVAARPDDGVDIGLLAWFQGVDDDSCLPERDVATSRCLSSGVGGAGRPELLDLETTNNPFQIVIAVTLEPGSAPGGYKLIVREPEAP